ncbi:XkdQ/YqbQ family protein [Anaerovorax sp. IOR16]|uniref:XkdQ/YqbQ family protein n=1 Tax=Anaerovorax sp. IOR16 TaxID=2773458 RepID=UPI0019D2E67C|nr:hypothetical protein [Anaerovorax sp. IOR16]
MIKLFIVKNGKLYDVPISGFSHTGRKGAAGRSFSADLLDSSSFSRLRIDIEDGIQCIAYDGDVEVFRGLTISQSRSKSKVQQITARDNLIYFANNDDTFNYKDKKASEIFLDLCTRFNIAYGNIADTEYIIPTLSIENGKLWDCVLESLQSTYKATGNRFYVTSIKGKAHLLKRKEQVQKWIIAEGANLLDYSYSKSIDGVSTRLKVISDNGIVSSFQKDEELEKKIGVFQKIIQKTDNLNLGQATQETQTSLKIESACKEQLTVSGLGINTVVSGCAIYAIIPEIGINQSYYVDEDTHTYQGDLHEMSLTLNKTNEI